MRFKLILNFDEFYGSKDDETVQRRIRRALQIEFGNSADVTVIGD